MPSAATSSNPYDADAVERDLIDPDDGTHALLGHAVLLLDDGLQPPLTHAQLHSTTSTTRCRERRTARRSRATSAPSRT